VELVSPGTTGRGGSYYDDSDVFERYLRVHDAPDRTNPTHVMEEPAVLAEVGDPAGLDVIDLGCGDALFGRSLLCAGAASYLGIDGSRNMVERAGENLLGTSGRVELRDLESFEAPPASVDLVTSRLAMHYVEDIDPVLAAVSLALRPGGRFVMTVVHPVITAHDNRPDGPRTNWTVDDYFDLGPRHRAWFGGRVTWHHRTIEHYAQSLLGSGLSVTGLRECEPVDERFGGDVDELARRRRVPLFLLLAGRA
jgi:SAM-dependent methyltransferase